MWGFGCRRWMWFCDDPRWLFGGIGWWYCWSGTGLVVGCQVWVARAGVGSQGNGGMGPVLAGVKSVGDLTVG